MKYITENDVETSRNGNLNSCWIPVENWILLYATHNFTIFYCFLDIGQVFIKLPRSVLQGQGIILFLAATNSIYVATVLLIYPAYPCYAVKIIPYSCRYILFFG